MLDIVELDESLKLRALSRLTISDHPFVKLVRAKLKLESYFAPSIDAEVDPVSQQGIEILRRDRGKMWADRSLDTDRRLIAAIRETNIKEVVTTRGQGSLAFFLPWARGARKVRDLTIRELERLSRHVAADKTTKLKIAIRCNLPPPEENFYKMYKVKQLYKPLGKISSQEFRNSRNPKDSINTFKVGISPADKESLTWGLRIRKLTNTSHKALLLRVAHGDIYTQDKLFRYGLKDTNKCPRCDEIETLKHKIVDCEYASRIWAQTDRVVSCMIDAKFQNQDSLVKALGMSKEDTIATLTLKAEVMQTILRLKPDQNYLLHPKLLVHNILKRLSIKERKQELRQVFINSLR